MECLVRNEGLVFRGVGVARFVDEVAALAFWEYTHVRLFTTRTCVCLLQGYTRKYDMCLEGRGARREGVLVDFVVRTRLPDMHIEGSRGHRRADNR